MSRPGQAVEVEMCVCVNICMNDGALRAVKKLYIRLCAARDTWIVDFGGGNTQGWIERDLHGSKAGDLQALDRITAELAAVWL
jgi:hypothetical protein